MPELKPCPFCGGDPVAIETRPGRGELYCGNCDVVLGGNNAMTAEELTDAWNTRAEPIVRCRDCAKVKGILPDPETGETKPCCTMFGFLVGSEGFCAWGERK